jgi:hypothetical protein
VKPNSAARTASDCRNRHIVNTSAVPPAFGDAVVDQHLRPIAVKAGANVKALQRRLGHALAAITLDVDADLFDDDLDAVGGSLDALRRDSLVAPMRPETL